MFASWRIFLRGEGIREIRTGQATGPRSRVSRRVGASFLQRPRHLLMINSEQGGRSRFSDGNSVRRGRQIIFFSHEISLLCRFVGLYFFISKKLL